LLVGVIGASAAVVTSAAIIGVAVLQSWRVKLPDHATIES
jgi:hypothetical protein